jgi:hypothetical protein
MHSTGHRTTSQHPTGTAGRTSFAASWRFYAWRFI